MKVKLFDVCDRGTSNYTQKDLDKLYGEYPIYGAGGFIKNIDTYQQDKEYIAVVKDGAGIGRTMFLPAKSSVIGTLQYILPKNNIEAKFLYYVIKAMHLERFYTGTTIPHIYFKDYQQEEFELPDKTEQKQIIRIFENLEGIIKKRQYQLQELDTLIKSRFVEMFGDEKRYSSISDLCTIITDGTHQPPEFIKKGIPFIFVSNIVTDKIEYDTEKFISRETYNELIKRTPIEIGDILLSTVGSYGHVAVVKLDKEFLFQRHIAYLKPRGDIVDSDYMHGALLAPDIQKRIEESVKGIAQKTLNLSEIKKMVIPVPDINRQKEFATFAQQTDKLKVA